MKPKSQRSKRPKFINKGKTKYKKEKKRSPERTKNKNGRKGQK